jgi:hypothetical protein
MTPCDVHFLQWWRASLRRWAGIATPHDLIQAKAGWEISMLIQIKLGAIE